MDYIRALISKVDDEIAYRIYMSDMLRLTADYVARLCGLSPQIPRYYEIMHPKPEKMERRSSDDIIRDIKNKLNAGGTDESI